MVTWVVDEIGCAGAMLDEFCIRNLAGNTVGWVFGLSMFSLKGEHIGWVEDGVFYDIGNHVLGFIPGAKGPLPACPALAPPPAVPVFGKRPCVPALRGRSARPARQGWSACGLATYLAAAGAGAARTPFMPHRLAAIPGAAHDPSPFL